MRGVGSETLGQCGRKTWGENTPFAPSILSQLHVWVGMGILSRVRIVQLYRLCKYSSALDNYEDFNPACCLVWSQSIGAATSWHCLPRLTGC